MKTRDDILRAVTRATGVTGEEILGKGRKRHVVDARRIAWHLAWETWSGMTVTKIINKFNASSGSFYNARSIFPEYLKRDPALRAALEQARAAL